MLNDSEAREAYSQKFLFPRSASDVAFDFGASYFSNPSGAAWRVKALVPHVRFVIILREPSDEKTWNWLVPSHDFEGLTGNASHSIKHNRFGDPIRYNIRMTIGLHLELAIFAQTHHTSYSYVDCRYSILAEWVNAFPRERFFLVRAEDIFFSVERRARLVGEIAVFLGWRMRMRCSFPIPIFHIPGILPRAIDPRFLKVEEEVLPNKNTRGIAYKRFFENLEPGTMREFATQCRHVVNEIVGREFWLESKGRHLEEIESR